MGKGIALQAKRLFPGVERVFGQAVAAQCNHLGEYNVIVSPHWPDDPSRCLGLFQSKQHFSAPSDSDLIYRSLSALAEYARIKPDADFHLPMPGTGSGKVSREQVIPLIEDTLGGLENVHLWEEGKMYVGEVRAVQPISPPKGMVMYIGGPRRSRTNPLFFWQSVAMTEKQYQTIQALEWNVDWQVSLTAIGLQEARRYILGEV